MTTLSPTFTFGVFPAKPCEHLLVRGLAALLQHDRAAKALELEERLDAVERRLAEAEAAEERGAQSMKR
ncbi:MAG: hypothetical protein OXJ62_14980 [Spirochaetaceae bacterium]|nr:hypothetical protein [Spirochaetaceae bacterium]